MPSLISNPRHGTLLLEVLNPLGKSPCSHDFSFLWVSAILLGKSGYYLVQKIRTLQSACKIRKTFYSLVKSLIKLIAWSWHSSMHTWANILLKNLRAPWLGWKEHDSSSDVIGRLSEPKGKGDTFKPGTWQPPSWFMQKPWAERWTGLEKWWQKSLVL